jgi:hypothetical protein
VKHCDSLCGVVILVETCFSLAYCSIEFSLETLTTQFIKNALTMTESELQTCIDSAMPPFDETWISFDEWLRKTIDIEWPLFSETKLIASHRQRKRTFEILQAHLSDFLIQVADYLKSELINKDKGLCSNYIWPFHKLSRFSDFVSLCF